jgi:hypothetical protein
MNNNDSLTQRGLFSGERRFELKNGRYLMIEVNRLKRNKSYQLDLVALKPKSKYRFTISWSWAVAAAGVMLLHYFLLQLLPQFFQIKLDDYALPLTLGMTSLAFIFLILFVATSNLERVFVASNTNFPLVRLLLRKPDTKSYRAFLSRLEKAIQTVSENIHLNDQQLLAGELRMMRRLTKYDVLTEKKYEQVKSRLMKMAST